MSRYGYDSDYRQGERAFERDERRYERLSRAEALANAGDVARPGEGATPEEKTL